MKSPIIAANWKLNKSPALTRRYFSDFLDASSEVEQTHSVFFPPAVCLEAAADALEGSPATYGAQNCWVENSGAFTGENSAAVIKDIGCAWVLVGHSERRQYFGEDEKLLQKKIQLIIETKLNPMYCIGETLEEREAGKEVQVWTRQLKEVLSDFDSKKSLAVAYEPVWAIGTGKVATPEQVQLAHQRIRKILTEMHGSNWASEVPILYGGSVKGASATELASIADVNGFLVGGASLEVASFLEIVQKTLEQKKS